MEPTDLPPAAARPDRAEGGGAPRGRAPAAAPRATAAVPPGERYRRARLAGLRTAALATFRSRPWLVAPIIGVNLTLLALSGYPTDRVVVVAVANVVASAIQLFASGLLRRSERIEDITFAASLLLLAVQAVSMVFTGGLTSPFTPVLVVIVANNAVAFGHNVRATLTMAAVCLIVVLLALLPEGWGTFEVPFPYNAAMTAIVLVTGSLIAGASIMQLTDGIDQAGVTMERLGADLLEQARTRASSLERLTSELSHELKNPLTSIKSHTNRLLGRSTDEWSRQRLQIIADEVSRLERILRDNLTLSRPLEALEPAPVELGGLVDDVVGALEAQAAMKEVTLVRDPGAATVVGDRHRLKEALFNLTANAIEATPPGGTVHLSVEPHADGASLHVRDSGKGMTPGELERIGTPFFTTRDGGTGLGVLLTRTVARQHGGELTYRSEPGRGTDATLRLPSQPPDADAPA